MQKTEKRSGKIVTASLIIIIPLILYLASFSTVIYNRDFIESQLIRSEADTSLLGVNRLVIDYLQSPEETMLIDYEGFTKDEKQHLKDVKSAVGGAFFFFYALSLSFASILFFSYRMKIKPEWSRVLIISGSVAAAFPFLLYVIPFEILFTGFHMLIFEPGTWIFPAESELIRLYPAEFWYNIAAAVFLRAMFSGIMIMILGFVLMKRKNPVV